MSIIITGKPFHEQRLVLRKRTIYPTNQGNLTTDEIAAIEGITREEVTRRIIKGRYNKK